MKSPSGRRPSVILAGAGPGDPALLTRAAEAALERADLVFYDALVSPEILSRIPKRKRVFVGKRGGLPSPKQSDINRRLIRAARLGDHVVRLKGGDPFLFGRGGEESDALRAAGADVRAIPGITAAAGAAAGAGFPLTDRRCASSLTLLTAAAESERGGKPAIPKRDVQALVRLGGTWGFYMGLRALPAIVRSLIQAGADPNLPAAVISNATTTRQRVVTARLGDIAERTARHRVESPAITIIGRVVDLRRPPLTRKPILVMRPAHQSGKLSTLLKKRGALVTEIPAIEIVPIRPNRALVRMISRMDEYDWLLLTSANTVRLLARILRGTRRRVKLAVIGPGTQEALSAFGGRADLIPERDYRSEGLAQALIETVRGRRGAGRRLFIALPQAEAGRDTLAQFLRAAGHRVDCVPMYRTTPVRAARRGIRAWIRSTPGGIVPLTSASMARVFAEFSRGLDLGHTSLVSIGPITTAEGRRRRLCVHAESPQSTLDSLIETIETVA